MQQIHTHLPPSKLCLKYHNNKVTQTDPRRAPLSHNEELSVVYACGLWYRNVNERLSHV